VNHIKPIRENTKKSKDFVSMKRPKKNPVIRESGIPSPNYEGFCGMGREVPGFFGEKKYMVCEWGTKGLESASASTALVVPTGTSLVYDNFSALEILTVEGGNGGFAFLLVRHLNKPETS
jgi:hypothetical protein